MDKPAIKKFAIWARNKLIADTKYRAGLVGVTETAVAEPLPQSNETVQFFDVGLPQPYRIEGDAVTQRQRFVAELNKETAKQGSYTAAYQTVVDKVAYTWFNRLIAVRYMQNEPISDTVRETTFRVYFVGEDNERISNENIVVADKRGETAAERMFRLRFSFKNQKYDNKKPYYLVAYDDKNSVEVLRRQVVMDIAMADDFGFGF